jgi:hypothetical protein
MIVSNEGLEDQRVGCKMKSYMKKDQEEILADEIFNLFNQMNRLIAESKNSHRFHGIVIEILEISQVGDPVKGNIVEIPEELGIKLPNSSVYLIKVDYKTLQMYVYQDIYPTDDETPKYILNVVSLSEAEGAGWLWGVRVIDTKTLALRLLDTLTGHLTRLPSGLVA